MKDLLERLQAATGPDRELDAELWCLRVGGRYIAMQDDRQHRFYYAPSGQDNLKYGHQFERYDFFTASVDAALELVERLLPGCAIRIQRNLDLKAHWCELQRKNSEATFDIWTEGGNRPTLPLAILVALLTALGEK